MHETKQPPGGYDCAGKREQREAVWEMLLRDVPRPETAKVALMPSDNCRELAVVLDRGIHPHNIFAVDWNPRTVAHIRHRYPLINTITGTLLYACRVLSYVGIRLHAINADLCCAAIGADRVLRQLSAMGCLLPNAKVAVTACRRGDPHINDRLVQQGLRVISRVLDRDIRSGELCHRDHTLLDFVRIGRMHSMLNVHNRFDCIRLGSYKSGVTKVWDPKGFFRKSPTTMLWAVFEHNRGG
jgi:hypothetical protein